MGTLNIQTNVFINFFMHFMVMHRLAENVIFIMLKLTESYEQSAGSMINQCCRLNCFGKGVLLKLDNVGLLLKMEICFKQTVHLVFSLFV